MAGPFDGLDQAFASQLQALIAASGGLLRPGSGRRTIEEQIQLRRTNGCPDIWTSPASSCRVPTAIPGRSNHNHGFAMDLVDASTGRAVQAGSAADRWLAANAANFGLHRPVGKPGGKGWEPWHVEPVDSDGMRAAQGRGAIGFNMNWMDEPGNPEDELASRLRTVMDMLVGDHPEGDAASLTEPASVPAPEALPDSEGFEGGQKTVTPSAGGVKGMVRQMAAQMGWGDDQWGALEELVQRESSWNPNAQNPTSTAFGLFQFLDKTWAKYGQKTNDPRAQAAAGLAYIRDRYGDPRSALSFHDRKGWY